MSETNRFRDSSVSKRIGSCYSLHLDWNTIVTAANMNKVFVKETILKKKSHGSFRKIISGTPFVSLRLALGPGCFRTYRAGNVYNNVRLEVFTAVNMMNAVFWDGCAV